MNALTQVRATDFPVLFSREPLARLLDAEGPVRLGKGWKVRPITDQEAQLLRAAQGNLERRLAVRSDEYIIAQLSVVANQFKSERTTAEWNLLYDDYANHLQEFPCAIFHGVLAQHRRTKTWFPKLAELVEGCTAELGREREDHRRIRTLLGIEQPLSFERSEQESSEPVRQRTPEEVKALIERTRVKHGLPLSPARDKFAAEVLERPRIPYVESTPEQKAERMAALDRRMNAGRGGS